MDGQVFEIRAPVVVQIIMSDLSCVRVNKVSAKLAMSKGNRDINKFSVECPISGILVLYNVLLIQNKVPVVRIAQISFVGIIRKHESE